MSQKPPRNVPHGLLLASVSAICLLVIWFLVLPRLTGSQRSVVLQVVGNLKRIQFAKEMWASDHGTSNPLQVSDEDLAVYVGPRASTNLVKPIVGEHYIVNPLGMSPEAQLTHDVGRWPSGSVIRLDATGIPPSHLARPGQ